MLPTAAYLASVRKVGNAPLEKTDAGGGSASAGFELIATGDPCRTSRCRSGRQDRDPRHVPRIRGRGHVHLHQLPDAGVLPADGPELRGTIQKKLKEQNNELKVHLLSVSFDPAIDTPAVMKKHAEGLGADPRMWSFVTGDRDEVDKWAAGFGMSISRALNDPRDITHNLRTAIIDRQGNLVQTYGGNEWTPEQVLADVSA